jgi:hypothetical protein
VEGEEEEEDWEMTGPKVECVLWLPMPNSSRLVLPTRRAPRARSWVTMVASKGEW